MMNHAKIEKSRNPGDSRHAVRPPFEAPKAPMSSRNDPKNHDDTDAEVCELFVGKIHAVDEIVLS
jgi:hypothetical protein